MLRHRMAGPSMVAAVTLLLARQAVGESPPYRSPMPSPLPPLQPLIDRGGRVWDAVWDMRAGRPYYVERVTGATAWVVDVAPVLPPSSPPVPQQRVAPGSYQQWDSAQTPQQQQQQRPPQQQQQQQQQQQHGQMQPPIAHQQYPMRPQPPPQFSQPQQQPQFSQQQQLQPQPQFLQQQQQPPQYSQQQHPQYSQQQQQHQQPPLPHSQQQQQQQQQSQQMYSQQHHQQQPQSVVPEPSPQQPVPRQDPPPTPFAEPDTSETTTANQSTIASEPTAVDIPDDSPVDEQIVAESLNATTDLSSPIDAANVSTNASKDKGTHLSPSSSVFGWLVRVTKKALTAKRAIEPQPTPQPKRSLFQRLFSRSEPKYPALKSAPEPPLAPKSRRRWFGRHKLVEPANTTIKAEPAPVPSKQTGWRFFGSKRSSIAVANESVSDLSTRAPPNETSADQQPRRSKDDARKLQRELEALQRQRDDAVAASAKQSALVDELRKSAERAAREASELRERVADSDAEVANLRRSFAQCDVRAPVKSEVLAESKIPDESEVQTPPSVVEVPAEAIAAAVLEVPAEAAVAGILDAKAQQQNQTRTRLRRTLRVTFVVVASTVVTAAIAIGARFLAVSQWRPSRPLALWRPSRPF